MIFVAIGTGVSDRCGQSENPIAALVIFVNYFMLICRWTEITVTVGGKIDDIQYVGENGSPSDHHIYVRLLISVLVHFKLLDIVVPIKFNT